MTAIQTPPESSSSTPLLYPRRNSSATFFLEILVTLLPMYFIKLLLIVLVFVSVITDEYPFGLAHGSFFEKAAAVIAVLLTFSLVNLVETISSSLEKQKKPVLAATVELSGGILMLTGLWIVIANTPGYH